MAVTEPLSVLTGGAGVGKTTVLKAVHRALESINRTVVQMALGPSAPPGGLPEAGKAQQQQRG